MNAPHHPYVGLRATSPAYEVKDLATFPAVSGIIVHVGGTSIVTLLLDDGRHTSRALSQIVLDDPAEAARRIATLQGAE